MRTRSQITASRRNLARRLHSPARGNGKVQQACRRALWVLNEASTSEILQFTYAGKLHRGERVEEWDSRSTRRALAAIGAVRIKQASTIGRPWTWRLSGSTPVPPTIESLAN